MAEQYTHKTVNGARIALTADEIAEMQAKDAAWYAEEPARQAAKARIDGLRAATQGLEERLRTQTSGQLDAYFTANVSSTAQAIDILKTVCKILAVR
jgi:hypothetical protein